MTIKHRPRIGLRSALVALIVASVVPFGLLLHFTWWRTATKVSHDLVDTLERQITDSVRRTWWGRVLEVQGLSQVVSEAAAVPGGPLNVERVLVASAASSPALSWVLHIPKEGEVLALQELGPQHTRLFRTDRDGRVTATADLGRDAPREPPQATPDARLTIFGQPWLVEASGWSEAGWVEVPQTPDGKDRAVAYVDPSGGGALVFMIGFDRFAKLLGDIAVGRTGRSFVLGPDGAIVIASHSEKAPRLAAMDRVALAAGRLVAARPETGKNVDENTRLDVDGAGYAVGLSPLWLQGWQLAIVVPEAEFLGPIDETIRNAAIGLVLFVIVASLIGILAGRRFVAVPIARLVDDLALIERFELEAVPRRASWLREIDRLSAALVRMSAGLADFAKFIPTDLVRSLLAEGIRAEPGGTRREVTVLFSDLAGFTGLSERLGDGIVPVVSSYLDLASTAIAEENGTIDKFIGDAVMAFWGAPRPDAEQALHACSAALAIAASVDRIALPPDLSDELRVRIGIESGPAVVGNIGSSTRLNYTALGDTVNLASRLEGVNKIYGTTIIIGHAARVAAGDRISARELDAVAVYGRSEGVRIYELIGLQAESDVVPGWIAAYEEALSLYRAGRFETALEKLDLVERLRPGDEPARRLATRCRGLLAEPLSSGWVPVTMLDTK
ncbi:MAG: adenylate/guanylate cyclase domain-containing protein [Microvirga sp.]